MEFMGPSGSPCRCEHRQNGRNGSDSLALPLPSWPCALPHGPSGSSRFGRIRSIRESRNTTSWTSQLLQSAGRDSVMTCAITPSHEDSFAWCPAADISVVRPLPAASEEPAFGNLAPTRSRVPSSWALTTSTVCSASTAPGVLQPEPAGVRCVSGTATL